MSKYNVTGYKGKVNIEYTRNDFPKSNVCVISEDGETLYQSEIQFSDLNKLINKLKRAFNVDEQNDDMLHMPEGIFRSY